MAIQREQQRRTVLLAALVVACAATSSAAGQPNAITRTADHWGADVDGRAPATVAQVTHSSGIRHPTTGPERAAVTNPYALARRFH